MTLAFDAVRERPAFLFTATTSASRVEVKLMIVARAKSAKYQEAVYEESYWCRGNGVIRTGFLSLGVYRRGHL